MNRIIEDMNIHSPKGTKVIFAFPKAGYEYQIKIAQKHLILNKVYTVDHIEIHKWHSNVYLKEIPDIGFNSCLFKEEK
jgi:hypothetical protein